MATFDSSRRHHAKKSPLRPSHLSLAEKRMRPNMWSEASVARATRGRGFGTFRRHR
ncbi:MAG: hypothetical protein QOD77_877 [Thermoplasmata archaeon]|jgi:hypothetical protein|nr:hypothetical protein [Thermoplasmata archaeon]